MSDFYGGREGRSFVIAKEFRTISEMVTNFQKGPSYTEVNFDEYVLINTFNKNNPENGQLFRRGYDFDSDRTILSYNLAKNTTEDGEKTFLNLEVPAGGAIYVGTIVGPAGRAPLLNLAQYDAILDRTLIVNSETFTIPKEIDVSTVASVLVYLNSYYPNGVETTSPQTGKKVMAKNVRFNIPKSSYNKYHYFHLDDMLYIDNSKASVGWYEVDTPPISGKDSISAKGHLIPGAEYLYENGDFKYQVDSDGKKHLQVSKYNDSIDWSYCSVRNENNEDCTAYIGFRVPSPVVEYEANSVDAYYNRNDILNTDGSVNSSAIQTNNFNNVNLVERDQVKSDIENHPFYSKWKINIPKGIKGDSIRNVRVITANNSVVAFKLDSQGNLSYDSYGRIQTEPYLGRDDDISHSRKIIVYDYTYYDRVATGNTITVYLGDFNKVDEITFGTDGTITLDYSHDDTVVYNKLVNWITDMALEENGTVTVTFNNNTLFNGKLTKSNLITWMNTFDLSENGTLTVKFNNNRLIQNISKEKFITWIKNVSFDSDTGTFNMTFNNDNFAAINHVFNYIKSVTRDNDASSDTFNHLLLMHSDPSKKGNITYNGTSGWVDLGGLGYIMAHEDKQSTELTNKKNALCIGGVWLVTETAPEGENF